MSSMVFMAAFFIQLNGCADQNASRLTSEHTAADQLTLTVKTV